MQESNKLEKLRKKITKVDKKLVKSLWKRMSLVNKVWEYKKENNIQVVQMNRWNEVLDCIIKEWKLHDLDEEFLKDIWNRIHEYAIIKES